LRIHPSAVVDPTAELAEDTIVGAGAVVGPGVQFGEGVEIGMGAVVAQYVRIGDGARISYGAVVVANVAAGALMVGNPARNNIGGGVGAAKEREAEIERVIARTIKSGALRDTE
jgi:UDP-3-O-[3-hydroxymyristoyl] glucosamine N-acyltransferase